MLLWLTVSSKQIEALMELEKTRWNVTIEKVDKISVKYWNDENINTVSYYVQQNIWRQISTGEINN